MREKIQPNDSIRDIVLKMSDGNPGAATLLVEGFTKNIFNFFTLLNLDDMNIRGSQLWVAYKDYCLKDIEALNSCINSRDPKMIEAINIETSKGAMFGYARDKAISSGASYLNNDDKKLFLTNEEIIELSKKEKPVLQQKEK